MEQTKKKLLLKDLCARLTYGVQIEIEGCRGGVLKGIDGDTISTDRGINYPLRLVKPYLRPMSSMTEEEKENYFNLRTKAWDVHINDYWYYDNFESYDYLNSIHVDYRGLIEKGLALEAPEGMYN